MDERRSAAERRYRQLLRLYPVGFRTRFGPDLLDLFRDQHRHASGRGRLALALFWVRVVGELVPNALAERLTARSSALAPDSPNARAARVSRGAPMEGVVQDIRYAVRALMHRPGLSLVIVVTLALGIGANTAIFSLVNTVLLRALPYPDSDRLVTIWEQNLARGDDRIPVRPANFFDWRSRVTSFEDVAWSRDAMYNLTGDGEPESIIGYRFSANMLTVLGVAPHIGRGFTAEDDRPGAARVAILSYKLWQRRYAGDPSVVGREITLNGASYTVVGVMPAAFKHPQRVELWTPIALEPALAARRNIFMLRLVGRLKPGRTIEQARAELAAIYDDLAKRYPADNTGLGINLRQLGDAGDARPLLATLFGGVGFVLLIACANVANLLLADSASRRREVAMRAALGASHARVVRQILTEAVLLALAGAIVGAAVTSSTADVLVRMFPKNIANLDLPLVERLDVDGRVWLFAFALSFLTGIVFGLLPAWNLARGDLQLALKDGERGGSSTRRTHAALVVAEVALSIVLLAGALLMVRSFVRLQQAQLGFDPEPVLSARVMLPQYRYPDEARMAAFTRTLVDRLRALPGVDAVGITNFLPLSGWWGVRTFYVAGKPEPAAGSEPTADFRLATEDYFRSMGIRLVAGRAFTAHDDGSAPPVVIVNETLARRYWPAENPVGRRMLVDRDGGGRETWEIVGVIADVKSFGLDEAIHAELFRPFRQNPFPLLGITVRTAVEPRSLAGALRQAVWSIDKDQPVTFLLPMADLASESLAFRRVAMMLAAGFAVLAVALAAVGIYGVLSYSVSRRTRELGVRVALGATRGRVAALVLREGMTMTACGIALGLLASFALTRYLASLLFEIGPSDPVTLAVVPVVLTVVALFAIALPARRATSVDPIVALRIE